MPKIRPSHLTLLALLFSGLVAFGQADRGIITGLVTDAQGAAIPNATVQIKDTGTSPVNAAPARG